MSAIFAVRLEPGTNWNPSCEVREQQHWPGHAMFMDGLFDRGAVLLAGPFADGTGALVICEAPSQDDVLMWFRNDPWTIHDVLSVREVKQGHVFLDARTRNAGECGNPTKSEGNA